jgi:predicted unusual protein kinase regulating ubiquinone biosynthesis (AarF/ABC1/UbiB family)
MRSLGIDPAVIGTILLESYLEQVLFNGFFHADPHAGNLAVDEQGNLIIYDFGMVGEITQPQRDALARAMVCIMNKDPRGVADNLIKLGVVDPDCNQESLVRILEPLFEYYRGKNIQQLEFSHLEQDIEKLTVERAFRLPPTLAYLLRAGSSVEGVARSLQADFSFVEAAKPFLKKSIADGRLNQVLTAMVGAKQDTAAHKKMYNIVPFESTADYHNTKQYTAKYTASQLVYFCLLLVSLSLLFLGTTLMPEYRHFGKYILTVSGILGALITVVINRQFY